MDDTKEKESEELELNNDKTNEDNQEDKEIESEASKVESHKERKQFYAVLFTMLILIAVFLASYYFFNSLQTIKYEGLTFTKEKFGEIPVFHHYYYITPTIKYNLYLRNDPRKNTIPITGAVTGIEFSKQNTIYISLEPEAVLGCEYGSAGISTLASFLVDNQLNVKGASPNASIALETGVEYATCENNPQDTVILIQPGNETLINQINKNCHVIQIANCEVMEAIEKYQVQAVLDARTRGPSN